MTQTLLRLVDDDRELELWRLEPLRDDIIIQELDVPAPEPREVVTDRPDDDGTDDDTRYHGATSVTLKLTVFDAPEGLLAQIRPFLRLDRRPWLCLTDDEWTGERRIQLRATPYSAPIPHVGLGVWREVQLQWKAPDGKWVASTPTPFAVLATANQSGGRTYPYSSPRSYGTAANTGQLTLTNGGEATHQVVRLYGPCAGPRWTCKDTGETIAFQESLVIPAGDYVEVDTRAGTANYLSDPDASRLGDLDFAVSSWWQIPAGVSSVRYHPAAQVDAGCEAQGEFSEQYLP